MSVQPDPVGPAVAVVATLSGFLAALAFMALDMEARDAEMWAAFDEGVAGLSATVGCEVSGPGGGLLPCVEAGRYVVAVEGEMPVYLASDRLTPLFRLRPSGRMVGAGEMRAIGEHGEAFGHAVWTLSGER